jgi:glycosyltransferase involved in cell wall biosynthesis
MNSCPNSADPYFTICIPVFNGEEFIKRAIQSVLDQTFDSWSLTIIDNKSTDGTWDLLRSEFSSHPKIRLLQNASNLGLRGNLNRCLEEARGQWLGILPADDKYTSHALQTIYEQTSIDPNLILWMHSHFVQGEGITPNICVVFANRRRFPAPRLAETLYLRGNLFGELSSYFVRCSAFQKMSLQFLDGTSQSADSRFWIRLLSSNPEGFAIYWPDALTHVFQHSESGSSANRRTGLGYSDIFEEAGDLAFLGWKRQILLRQAGRLLKCWCKFGRMLPADAGGAPAKALKKLGNAFCRGPVSPFHR